MELTRSETKTGMRLMSTYSVYAVTPMGQMLGPILWVEANSDNNALNEAQTVTDHVLAQKF